LCDIDSSRKLHCNVSKNLNMESHSTKTILAATYARMHEQIFIVVEHNKLHSLTNGHLEFYFDKAIATVLPSAGFKRV